MKICKPKVLIVEDDIIIATDIKKFLQKKNYEIVSVVRHGFKAVDIALEKKPDIVLMDIMLEGYMNGIEAAEKIIGKLKIPVIFLTALNDDETFLSAAAIKPFAFINKPFVPEKLEKAISSALKNNNGY
jgi:DNA-binding NarL/FixJ family response regulator